MAYKRVYYSIGILLALAVSYYFFIEANVNAVNIVTCRGITYRKGPTYTLKNSEEFLMSFIISDDELRFFLVGEIANPSFTPVTINSFDFEVHLNDMFIFKDNLEIGLIPANSYFELNKMYTIDYSSMDPSQVNKILSIRSMMGKKITLHGTLHISCNGVNGVQTVAMSIVEG